MSTPSFFFSDGVVSEVLGRYGIFLKLSTLMHNPFRRRYHKTVMFDLRGFKLALSILRGVIKV
ncbi:hypothetical protein BpHYR1_047000 [Brachionus plicatilis]|uniref:Uncharacterized protein n=1 Tax=Brachionus plicatilis TaxID=10195 RepID=A0A3M7SDD5_BRAPC|nr:hypothetical protein BpHYR1_047000 [Brachionus plicatilis]